MIDVNQAFRIRLVICKALQDSQKSEGRATERTADLAVTCKRELLSLLSAWLMGLKSATALTAAEHGEIQSLTRMPLDRWIQLQNEAERLEIDLKDAQGKEKEAEAALQKKTPFGSVTKAFADADSKRHIKVLQDGHAAAQRNREGVARALKQNVGKRQVLAETFFRDCLSQLDKLALTKVLGKEAAVIHGNMVAQTNALWAGHLKQQAKELDEVAKLFDSLRASYKDTSQSQGKTPPAQGNTYDLS